MDPKAKPIIVGDADGSRTWLAVTVWAAEYLGWNLRWIYGYPGTGELVLALRQGEFDMFATQNAKIIQGLLKDGVVESLAQQDDERRPDFLDVPTFEEILGAKKPSGTSWQAYLAWAGPAAVDKFLVAPQGTPDDVVRVLREAFRKMDQDPEFKDQATKFFGAAWRLRPGDKAEALIREVTTVSPEAQALLAKLRKKYGLPVGKPAKKK
jgi:tripartite-type tricarboxylate transporter receptor subunit TctC